MSLEELISTYGYVTIAIGTFLEGETILVLGGFSAHRGYLQLPLVILWGFIGSFAGDQIYFHIGRSKGEAWLEGRRDWKVRSGKVLALLTQHQILLILGFRFLYGLRTVTPFLIGAARVSPTRFFVLNLFGALIWASVVGALGYFFGEAVEVVIGEVERYELEVFALLMGLGLVFWFGRFLRGRRKTQ